jgi:hypothetical protein
VLVEALTLIVPKKVLDISYPGGTDAYLQSLLDLERPPRFVCGAESKLTNASFYDFEHLMPAVKLLEQHSIVVSDDGAFVEAAIIAQGIGPKLECWWLEWREHAQGFTYAWQTGTDPGDMAAPKGWTPEQSRSLTRYDLRDEEGRGFKLGGDEKGETWLDLQTGYVIDGLPVRSERTDMPSSGGALSPTLPPLMPVVLAAIESEGSEATQISNHVVALETTGEYAHYRIVLSVNDETRVVACTCQFPIRIPAERRATVAELLNRINYEMAIGTLYVDMDGGSLFARTAIDVEGGDLTPKMAVNLMGGAAGACELSFQRVMGAAFGDTDSGEVSSTLFD